jgi:ribosome biogenesis GTPase A
MISDMDNNPQPMPVQWYPGHMSKSIRMMRESISLVDVLIEIVDARCPRASRNPDIDSLAGGKKRLIVLNKCDLADPIATTMWIKHFGAGALATNSTTGEGIEKIAGMCRKLMQDKIEKAKRRGRLSVPVRAMIAGVPNVGKSTLINKFVGASPTKTGNKPGVTRGRQWIRLKQGFDLLDTPGILWHRFDDAEVGINLALTGAITDNILDTHGLALILMGKLRQSYPSALKDRFGAEDIIGIARARGYVKFANEADTERAAAAVINDFRSGKLGRITLEKL